MDGPYKTKCIVHIVWSVFTDKLPAETKGIISEKALKEMNKLHKDPGDGVQYNCSLGN